MGRSFELDEATRKMYPPDTFTEVTADRKGTIKTEKFDLTYVGSEEEAKRLYPNNTEIQKLIPEPATIGDDMGFGKVVKITEQFIVVSAPYYSFSYSNNGLSISISKL